jgi:hypothetical protein
MQLADVPEKYRQLYNRAVGGQSKTDAIHANCLICRGWEKEEVRNCTSPDCPMFPYRPYRIAPSAQNRDVARARGKNSDQLVLSYG